MSSTIVTGYGHTCGFLKQPTTPWGTGASALAGAGDGVEFLNESLTADSQLLENMQVSGSPHQLPGVKGNELHAGMIECDCYYQGLEPFLARCFGSESTPTLVGTSVTTYKRVLKPASDLTGIYGSLVMNSQVAVREWPYVKVGGVTIDWQDGKITTAKFDLVPFTVNYNQGTAATAAIVAAVLPANGALTIIGTTYTPTAPQQVKFTLVHTSGTITAINVTVVGTDKDNNYQSVLYTNPVLSAGPLTYTTIQYWRTVTSITISGLAGTATGETIAAGNSPGINNAATVSSITLPSKRDFVLFNTLHAWINDQGGIALTGTVGGADETFLQALQVKIDLQLLKSRVTTRFGFLTEEPVINGFVKITGSLKFADWNSDNHPRLREYMAKDLKKMWWRMQGPISDSTTSPVIPYEWDFYFNNVQFAKGSPNVSGPGVIPWDLTFQASRALSVPTGFPSGYSDALTMEITNQRSTAAL
jgi:hypothetical protein